MFSIQSYRSCGHAVVRSCGFVVSFQLLALSGQLSGVSVSSLGFRVKTRRKEKGERRKLKAQGVGRKAQGAGRRVSEFAFGELGLLKQSWVKVSGFQGFRLLRFFILTPSNRIYHCLPSLFYPHALIFQDRDISSCGSRSIVLPIYLP